jgi:hypothetical protein
VPKWRRADLEVQDDPDEIEHLLPSREVQHAWLALVRDDLVSHPVRGGRHREVKP